MKNGVDKKLDDRIFKEVIVIGNGPSGILVSLLLSGRLPILTSTEHPDEMLSARLKSLGSKCLLIQDLDFLAQGLEGRCMNPVSLLMDALLHPCADLGLDLKPLVEFRPVGTEIDHLVIGRGPPGGSWHRIDPDVLTLSLSSWMALPNQQTLPQCSVNEKRAYARDVAVSYEKYVESMNLKKYFLENTLVTSVESAISNDDCWRKKNVRVKKLERDVVERVKDYFEPVVEDAEADRCFLTNALNCLLSRNSKRVKHGKRTRNSYSESGGRKHQTAKSEPIIIPKHERKRSISCCCCCGSQNTQENPKIKLNNNNLSHTISLERNTNNSSAPRWLLEATNLTTGQNIKYSCNYLVLACGTYDSPNRLTLFKNIEDPHWLLHDLRSLETKLDEKLQMGDIRDPVLIVGGGLSAADAVMAVRSRNVPILHVFRGKTAEFVRQLPENMYPEYHKVRQMMTDGGTSYPLYKAYPEHSVTDFDVHRQTVRLTSHLGEETEVKVSFAAVLIGSRPNLNFLPKNMKLGVYPDREVDSKTNPVNINPLTHEVLGYDGLFAVGPLAGDNFVRYIPGGAVAVVSELYKRWGLVNDY
ncbi:oxidative stress-induced growth inhibitor 1-like isoform X2 [Anthonomus grandis grandis]|nr:oxidative stress-induced growth inhibitor 1-like isoform X2 [Anthonomus grandis grandis]